MTDIDRQETETLSALYHALRAVRRQYIIRELKNADEKLLTTRELAREIASREKQVPIQEATGEPYRNAYNALSQTHLSTLSETGIIIYDPKRQTVQRGTNFDLAVLLLDTNVSMANTITALQKNEEENS